MSDLGHVKIRCLTCYEILQQPYSDESHKKLKLSHNYLSSLISILSTPASVSSPHTIYIEEVKRSRGITCPSCFGMIGKVLNLLDQIAKLQCRVEEHRRVLKGELYNGFELSQLEGSSKAKATGQEVKLANHDDNEGCTIEDIFARERSDLVKKLKLNHSEPVQIDLPLPLPVPVPVEENEISIGTGTDQDQVNEINHYDYDNDDSIDDDYDVNDNDELDQKFVIPQLKNLQLKLKRFDLPRGETSIKIDSKEYYDLIRNDCKMGKNEIKVKLFRPLKLYCLNVKCHFSTLSRKEFKAHNVKYHGGDKGRPHLCSECNRSFRFKSVRDLHYSAVHIAERIYKCTVCSKGFSWKISLQRHELTHRKSTNKSNVKSGPPVNRSSIAIENLDLDQILNEMALNHPERSILIDPADEQSSIKVNKSMLRISKTGKIRIKCPMCQFSALSQISLQGHILRKHKNIKNPYPCTFEGCLKTFSNTYTLNVHTKVYHTREMNYFCDKCSAGFIRKQSLRNHYETHFDTTTTTTGDKRKKPRPKIYKCPVSLCGKTFSQSGGLSAHQSVHEGTLYICEFCSRSYTSKNTLKHHQSKVHHGTGPVCDICGLMFTRSASLRDHMMLHNNTQPFFCTEPGCNRRFIKNHILQKHLLIHKNERSFKCLQCEKTFNTSTRLQAHVKIVHCIEKNHRCRTCQKGFASKDRLRRHELIHSGLLPYICEICGKAFPVRNYLYIHMRSHNKTKNKN